MAWALPSVQPTPQGLYDARHEHDACGVAFVATLTGVPSHTIVEQALTALRNLEHRGASGAEPDSGDGAGLLVQVPDTFLRAVVDFELPAPGSYAVGNVFLPLDAPGAAAERIEDLAAEEGLLVLGWRDLPVAPEVIGSTARAVMPVFRQLFVSSSGGRVVGMALERRAFRLRKRAELLARCLLRVAVGADPALQGDAHHRPARAVLPGPVRRTLRQRPRARALAVLHQHVPVLAAGSPVPLHRAQRGDQHRARQPQLDAGAGVAAGQRPDPRRPQRSLPDLHPGHQRLGLLRRGPGAAAPRAAGRSRTPC